jgi:hypothetical protein
LSHFQNLQPNLRGSNLLKKTHAFKYIILTCKINDLRGNLSSKSAYTVDTQFTHKIKQNQGVEHGIYAPKNVAPHAPYASTMCRINAVCANSVSLAT